MTAGERTGLLAVAHREIRWIWHDKVALVLVTLVPLIAFAILAGTFSNAVIRDLRIDIVDEDGTPTSTAFVQAINAAPGISVATRSSELNGAMHAIRSGAAIAAVYLPRRLEQDMLAGKRPQIVIFYNKQFFTPGNLASSSLQSALSAAAGTMRPAAARAADNAPGALVVQQYVLTNPALSYAQFLLRAILPTVLHVIMGIAGGYAVGSEFGSRGLAGWLRAAGGSPLTALIGKLVPYFGIFALLMVVELGIIHGFFQVPFRGDPLLVGVSACLLIIAYLSVGALFQLLTRNLASGLTLTGIVCSPAFGFAGVGFPVLAMGAFGRAWGAILPVRWYIQILFDQAARGSPVSNSFDPLLAFSGLCALYFGLALLRLRSVARRPMVAKEDLPDPDTGGRIGLGSAFAFEYRRVLRDRGIFGMIVLGPVIYGAFYPQPYLGELVRNIPIAVVDNDGSDLSRSVVQALGAHEAVKVAARMTTLADANAALARREVFGILSIPSGTQREVLKGNQARLPAYVDSAYFILYSRTLQGIMESVGSVNAELTGRGARSDGALYRAALARSSPVEILNQPLFNPTGGYGSYVVPAAFILILQQMLLMGAATVGGVTFTRGGLAARLRRGRPFAVVGQALAHLLLVLPGFALYLVLLPRLYGFTSSDNLVDLLAFAIPFILAVSFLGQFIGSWFRRRETAVLLMIAISLPLFFLVGVAWPPEAIPETLRRLSMIFPSTFGIDGLLRVNQMGASFSDVADDWRSLWVQAVIYATLAMLASGIARARGKADAV